MSSPLGISFKLAEGKGIQSANEGGISQYRVVDNKAVKSIFGNAQFSPYPSTYNNESGSVEGMRQASDVHDDNANDIRVSSIIEYTNQKNPQGGLLYPAMKLDYSHFAYLKNLGVYPNNRLIVARRFAGGVGNDLTQIGGTPLATIVSYFSDAEDTLSITYGEEWTEAEGGFEEVLNDIGEDILQGDNRGGKLGSGLAAALNVIPLPAITEGLQLEVLNKLGLSGAGQGFGKSPMGNPNIIREAKQRKILKKAEAGSGLKAAFTVKMTVEYEQKFIGGLDPTLVYMDLIQNALTFGTSDSAFQFSPAFGMGATNLIKNLISGDIGAIIQSITQFVSSLVESLGKVIQEFVANVIDPPSGDGDQKDPKPSELAAAAANSIMNFVRATFAATVGTVISKYKIRLMGISNALTGSPSAPWHITLGNPKKPIFTSGDMVCSDINLTLGKTLAFNDLPSTIKLELTFTNARNLGAQEIFNRLNTGRGRSYVRLNKSFVEVSDGEVEETVKKEVERINKEKGLSGSNDQIKITDEGNGKGQSGSGGSGSVIIKDDYPVVFNPESGFVWGEKPPVTNDTAKIGDPTGSQSGLSQSNTIPPTGSSQSTATNLTPGVSASTPQPETLPATPTPQPQPPKPDVNLTVSGAISTGGDPVVFVKNNGVIIKEVTYSATTFTLARAIETMQFQVDNFGVSGDDGEFYPAKPKEGFV